MQEEGLLYKELSYKINGILFDVQNSLGTKFQEKHYVRAVCGILDKQQISYQTEVSFQLKIDDIYLGTFRTDLIVDNKIVIEFKATDRLTKDHKLQMLRYLDALHLQLGLLINFRVRPLQIWRIPHSRISTIRGAP